jgi:transposase
MVQEAKRAEEAAEAALDFAHKAGNSYRELEAATGLSYRTINRICDRLNEDGDDLGAAEGP